MKRWIVAFIPALAAAQPAARQTAYDRVELQSTGADVGAPEFIEWGRQGEEDLGVIPAFHEVKKGDTLWDVCARYFASPWHWPRVWALNPQITNPHWIYPGDRILLMPPEGSPQAEQWHAMAQRAAPPRAGGFDPTERLRSDTLFLRQHAFVEEAELRTSGTIVGARDDKMLLSAPDEAYVQFGKETSMRPGDRYAAYRPVQRVRSGDRDLGWLVEILGTAEVREITKAGVARATLVETANSVERGTRVGPVRQSQHQMAPVRNDRDLDGAVAASLPDLYLVGTDHVVVLDRGQADGVNAGNRFFIMRVGDRLEEPLTPGSTYPPEAIAEVLVVEPKKHASIGLVTRARREVKVGDRVQMKRGY